jgi:glycerate kinase
MHILIAPNAFKNSLSSPEAAEAIERGLQRSGLDCTTECFPIGDGGDGTGTLLNERLGSSKIAVRVNDPLGREIASEFGLGQGGRLAIIEMADASGLRLLRDDELDPLRSDSFGTGELISCALDHGAAEIVLAVGGSATVDGATGILRALGVRFLDAAGNELADLPEDLVDLSAIDLSRIDRRMSRATLTVLCDVNNLLLGPQGAARLFGPQKGATPEAVNKLEAALSRLRDVVLSQTGKDMSSTRRGGAAGGVAASLNAFLNASLVSGIDYFLNATNFDLALSKADLVVTGEGSIDEQTLQGKGPIVVAARAKAKDIPVVGLAGAVPSKPDPIWQQYFDVLLPISSKPLPLEIALTQTAADLERTACELGNVLASKTTLGLNT